MEQETSIRPAGTQLGPVRQWRIHIGAHKTATTHLQETLTRVRPDLAARGIDYLPNPLIRTRRLSWVLWRRRPMARLPILGPAHMRSVFETTFDPIRTGPETVVLSEENILGMPHHILSETFYPLAEQTLSRIASLGGRADLQLFLSIRSYDALLPSAYVESLKHSVPAPGGFEALRERLLANPPSWYDLLERIHAAAPGVPIRIWRQEDYRANAQEIMEEFCGCPLGELPEISDPSWTRTPSATAIAAAERVPEMPQPERLVRVKALFSASAPGDDRFNPLSDAERRQLRGRYEADLARIAETWPGAMMRFASAELAA